MGITIRLARLRTKRPQPSAESYLWLLFLSLLTSNSLKKGKQTAIGINSPLYSLVTGRIRYRTYLSAKQKNNFIGVKPAHILPALGYSENFLPLAANHGYFEGVCAIPVFRFISIT